MIIHGDADDRVPVANSAGYVASAAGDLCRIEVLAGVDHFAVIDPLSPAWKHVVTAVGELR